MATGFFEQIIPNIARKQRRSPPPRRVERIKMTTRALLIALVASMVTIAGCGGEATPTTSAPTASETAPTREPNTEQPVNQAAAPEPIDASQAARWAEFLRYGPELVGLLKRSEAIDRAWDSDPATGRVTVADMPALGERAGRDSKSHADFARAASQVRVPAADEDALEFRKSVVETISARAHAAVAMKAALARRDGPAGQVAARDGKRNSDEATTEMVAKLGWLCAGMGATKDDCAAAVGWS